MSEGRGKEGGRRNGGGYARCVVLWSQKREFLLWNMESWLREEGEGEGGATQLSAGEIREGREGDKQFNCSLFNCSQSGRRDELEEAFAVQTRSKGRLSFLSHIRALCTCLSAFQYSTRTTTFKFLSSHFFSPPTRLNAQDRSVQSARQHHPISPPLLSLLSLALILLLLSPSLREVSTPPFSPPSAKPTPVSLSLPFLSYIESPLSLLSFPPLSQM